MPSKDIVLARRGTLAEWAAKTPSPILALGEIAVETDTHKMKVGDGVTTWALLPYITCPIDAESITFQIQRDTSANLTSTNPVLPVGVFCLETDTGDLKVGDGSTAWNSLKYVVNFGTAAGTVCAGDDSRLSDARTPVTHSTSHGSAGSDPIKLDALAAPDDSTTLDASATKHGLLKKLDDNTAHFLRGDGSWNFPNVDGGSVTRQSLVQARRDTSANLEAYATPFDAGEFVFDTTTGKTAIGDGESLWVDLPDIRKQFPNVVTVAKSGKKGSADFICSDSVYGGSDAACIQAAVDYCATKSITELWLLSGTYTFATKVTFTHNITVCGIGKVILVSSQSSGANPEIFDFSGSKISTIAGSDVLAGAVSITVSDASSIQVGDMLLISDSTKWNVTDYPNLNTGELHEVESVSGTSVSFIDGLLHSYSSTNSLSIDVIRPIATNIKNIEFRGTSSTVIGGLVLLKYCNNSSVVGCVLSNDGYYGISVLNSIDCYISNNKITNFKGSGYGYGISVNDASAHITISKNKIRLCRHCVASGGYAEVGQARDIHVSNNTLFGGRWVGAEHLVDAHPCVESISVYNNTFYCNTRSAFISGAKFSSFYDNQVYNGSGASIRGNLQNITFYVNDNKFYSCSYAFLDSLTENCSVTFANIQNNHMINSVYYIARTRVTKDVLIVGNHIDQTTDYHGIEISNATSGVVSENHLNNIYRNGIVLTNCSNLLLSSNILINCCQRGVSSDLSEAGIAINGSSYIYINTNSIIDANGKMYYGIREYTTSNNNILDSNVISGASTSSISKLGSNTKVFNNPGYLTENTGTATITATFTSVVVDHGLATTPTNVIVTPRGNIGSVWADTFTTTQFTIHCSSAPASDTVVGWSAVV